MTHLVKYLPSKHEDLNLVPRTHLKQLSMAMCPYNFSVGKSETGNPGDRWPESLASERPPTYKARWGLARGLSILPDDLNSDPWVLHMQKTDFCKFFSDHKMLHDMQHQHKYIHYISTLHTHSSGSKYYMYSKL